MSIFKQIRDSLYNPKFFRGLLDKPLSFSIIYYLKLISLLPLMLVISFSLFFVGDINNFLWQLKPLTTSFYPADLVISVTQGQVSINQPEPYKIVLPADFDLAQTQDVAYKNLLVIDTKATTTDKALEQNQTIAFLASSTLVFGTNQDSQIFPLKTDVMATISSTTIREKFATIEPFYKFVAPVAILALFIFSWLILFCLLGLMFVLAGLSWVLLSLVLGQKVTYLDAVKVTIHASTLPLLTSYLLFALNIPFGTIFFFVITLIIIYANFSEGLSIRK